MAHLHCIDHGQRVVVVSHRDVVITQLRGRPQARVTEYTVALHRNGGRTAVRCDSMLKIRHRQYTPGMVQDHLTQIRVGYRQGKPHQTSSR